MPNVKIGPRTKVAAADLTGANPGNLTTTFAGADLNTSVPFFECYKMIVTNVPPGASATIYVNNQIWSFTYPYSGSEWDPTQPLQLTPDDQIDFRWNVASSTTPAPVTTIWLRYDPALSLFVPGAPG